MRNLIRVLVLNLLFFLPQAAQASMPMGVWATVDSVTYEPNADSPTKVRIVGVFVLSSSYTDWNKNPTAGQLYYQCPKGNEATCKMEWQEIAKKVGSKTGCLGWSGEAAAKPKLYACGDKPMIADDYPIVSGTFGGYTPCQWVEPYFAGGGAVCGAAGGEDAGAAPDAGSGSDANAAADASSPPDAAADSAVMPQDTATLPPDAAAPDSAADNTTQPPDTADKMDSDQHLEAVDQADAKTTPAADVADVSDTAGLLAPETSDNSAPPAAAAKSSGCTAAPVAAPLAAAFAGMALLLLVVLRRFRVAV